MEFASERPAHHMATDTTKPAHPNKALVIPLDLVHKFLHGTEYLYLGSLLESLAISATYHMTPRDPIDPLSKAFLADIMAYGDNKELFPAPQANDQQKGS